jgi:hypothetical protein
MLRLTTARLDSLCMRVCDDVALPQQSITDNTAP